MVKKASLKVLHLSTFDAIGGAARAMQRLHDGLLSIEATSVVHVQRKVGDDATISGPATKVGQGIALARPYLDQLPIVIGRYKPERLFSPSYLPNRIQVLVGQHKPDVVHLHWIAGGFINVEALKDIRLPLLWTLHDMWPFTGGCHVDDGCGRYVSGCGKCPVLSSSSEGDLSSRVLGRKVRHWTGVPIRVIAPSRWIAGCARESRVFGKTQVSVIPNALDVQKYKPITKDVARLILGIPLKKLIVLFGAVGGISDSNKGFDTLVEALRRLRAWRGVNDCELHIFGSSKTEVPDIGVKIKFHGRLYDDYSLALLYSAADVVAVPSKQESFGQVAAEAQACGTPVVAFGVTGLLDVVEHRKTGFLAKPFDVDDFAAGLGWILDNSDRRDGLSTAAREWAVHTIDKTRIAELHMRVYETLLQESRGG